MCTSINEAALSGEFMPVTKQLGDSVTAGTVNVANSIDIVVTQLNSNNRLQQILSLVQQAHSFRPKLSQRADTVAHYFVFAVLLVAASVYGIWYFIDAGKAFWITLSVLVITCPCALSLVAPTATAVATASLRKHGLLMTREDALEQVAKVDTIVFDKTGTLTTGAMALEQTISLGDMDEALYLQLACALESQSEHPIARAFSQALSQETHTTKILLTNYTNHPSLGVSGTYNGLNLLLGQAHFACETTSFVQPIPPQEHGQWLLLADQTQALAWFKLSDTPRKGLQNTIDELKHSQYELHILSGDHNNNVAQLAQDYAFDHWQGEQNPQQKVNYIKQLQQQGKIVMMVGDGINDAPVMAAANAALAMASGTDLSKSSAPALLLRDDLNLIQVLLRKAQQTHTIMQQNLTWALLYNLIALPLAATGMIPPWGAAIGMSMSSLIVVLNATRLKPIDAQQNK
jgi:Cu2+-exporting ATPase